MRTMRGRIIDPVELVRYHRLMTSHMAGVSRTNRLHTISWPAGNFCWLTVHRQKPSPKEEVKKYMKKTYLRGEIYYADLGTGIGSEQNGYRPVVVIQNDVGNKYSPTTIVAAISAQIKTKAYLPISMFLPPAGLHSPLLSCWSRSVL